MKNNRRRSMGPCKCERIVNELNEADDRKSAENALVVLNESNDLNRGAGEVISSRTEFGWVNEGHLYVFSRVIGTRLHEILSMGKL